MKGWNLLHKILKYVSFASAETNSKNFFSQETELVFYNDVCSVTEALGHQHDPTECRLFINSRSYLKICASTEEE
jgi:hypothetical protein